MAKNTIGTSNEIFELELETLLILRSQIEFEIKKLESNIEEIIKELNPPILSIKGIGYILGAGIYLNMEMFLDLNQLMQWLLLLVLNQAYANLVQNHILVIW